jgi:hypothetical protein
MVFEFTKPGTLSDPGFIPVQRTVDVPWGDYRVLDDVVLLPRQSLVDCEPVSQGNAGFYVSPPESDTRGSRRFAVYVPSTVTAMATPGKREIQGASRM